MYSKNGLIRLYKKETNIKVKERLLLVIKVKYDNIIPAYAADELHRSRPWALYWLKRYVEEGIEGLKNRPKSGRHPDIPEEKVHEIKNELASRKEGWTTKQVEDLIVKKSGRIRYHYTHIYRLMHKWGFKQKIPRKVHVNTASKEDKERFKKEQERYYWILSSSKKDLQ
ncbi:MAG TPA: helix-turn-helix domain-containing protein [Nitrososphaeraceae archaeon]|nr:helix-turn-helix domain-containing protein [Nitrososphaeraceae archaeon]